jgi:non-canonical poly(A) RNA polymerase PAPD5/7
MAYMRPTKDEVYLRRNLIARFTAVIKKITPISTVRPVGSCVTGLYYPTSDIEMVIDSLPIPLSLLENEIWNSGFASRIDSLLDDSAAPLLRIVDAVTGIEIALSAADGHAVKATNAVQAWIKGDTGEGDGDRTVIACLVMVLKMFLSIRRLGSTYTGGIHSYLLVWMVVAWVKLGMPRRAKRSDGLFDDAAVGLRSVSKTSSTSSNSSQGTSSSSSGMHRPSAVPVDLGSALLGFLRFYGQEFDYENKSIQFSSKSVRYASKPFLHRTAQKYLLCITDPADSSVDLGFKAYGMKHVRETFRDAYVTLVSLVEGTATRDELVRARFEGALGCVLGGDYSRFVYKRKRILRKWRSHSE